CASYPQYIGQHYLVGWRVSAPRRKPRWPAHQTLY
ncbi:bacterial regulatory, arsR family protein, partial [Vibrio parahaemolyticus AQ3810]